jgi:hypothetical protein
MMKLDCAGVTYLRFHNEVWSIRTYCQSERHFILNGLDRFFLLKKKKGPISQCYGFDCE